MSEKKTDSVQNVGCNVKDCKYHCMPGYCNARHINVQNERAQCKSETFCATFESKGIL